MITGASTAQVAIVMIDARKGVLTQTRRHSYLVSLIGIRHIVLAVNKLDMVDYSPEVFARIEADYRAFAAQIGLTDITAIPMSALRGDNVTGPSDRTPWYHGPCLMEYLESVAVEDSLQAGPLRMPVQWVNRPNLDFRGFSGFIVGGTVRPGDRVRALPSGQESTVTRIVTRGGDLPLAVAGQSITLTLADEIDISRGDVLASAGSPASVADQIEATLVWMSETPLEPGRPYLLKIGARTAGVTVRTPRYKVNVNTMEQTPTPTLTLNEIGVCELSLDRTIAFDPYEQNRDMGGFILIDRLLNSTIAAGLIHRGERRQPEQAWSQVEVDHGARAALKGQQAAILWFSGGSAAALARRVEQRLFSLGRHTYLLDESRADAPADLLASARLLADAGLLVLVARASSDAKNTCDLSLDPPFDLPSTQPLDLAGSSIEDATETIVARLRALKALEGAAMTADEGI
jgi:bifunctional enzyme CysN/CysC